MRGALRLGTMIWTAGLLLAPADASAQDSAPAASTNTPAADAVGPRELQDFSLPGNVTRPAEPVAERPAAEKPATAQRTEAAPARAETPAAADRVPAQRPRTAMAPAPAPAPAQAPPDLTPQPLPTMPAPVPQQASTPSSLAPLAEAEPTASLAPDHLLIWPWILAAISLGAGAAFLFWRNRSHRHALAGGPQIDLFTAPEPVPAPAPAPPPPPPAPAPRSVQPPRAPAGVVSTGLRAWLDVAVQPLRCTITDEAVAIEFEIELFNSGSSAARDIHVAAVVINAGPDQDQELATFFARAAGPGNRIETVLPLKRMNFSTQLVLGRDQVRPIELGGRPAFVPLLAFNVIYGRNGGEGQTSVAYLVGRDGNGGKLAPFRLDLGARVFRTLGARLLPNGVQR